MQKVRFLHPVSGMPYETQLPLTITFREISETLISRGFIDKKPGGYQFIIDDRLCNLAAALGDYLPYPVPELVDIRIHGLLIVLT